ncbi:hypothetical protein D3C87_102430 [compost metagenome]
MKYILLLLVSAMMFGCGHHRDVRASANGVHVVKLQAEDKDEGSRQAIAQANHFCEQRKQSAAFVDESQTYTGNMDEKDYHAMKTAGKVASTVGGTTYVLGGQKESTIGGIVGLGGVVAGQVAGNGYTIQMRFKCM